MTPPAAPWRVAADAFTRIYDPSVGEDEAWYVNDHTVFVDHAGTWHLVGITHAEPFDPHHETELAHATAPDLHGPWTKQPSALVADLDAGETVLWAPHVIEHDGTFWMFVCAGGADKTAFRLQLATSPDGWAWTRHPDGPLFVDGYEARDPMVCRVGDRWVLYHTATETPEGGHHVVVARESDDLVHWHGRHVVYRDRAQGTLGGPTESPFVVRRGGRWYLFIGPDWEAFVRAYLDGGWDDAAYRRTRVLVSDDPLAFSIEGLVGIVEGHAVEVVVDGAGRDWVTHCGWGQGGVHLAPLPPLA